MKDPKTTTVAIIGGVILFALVGALILHKIERVKELIIYDELNLNEIAYKLNYSSSAHLSNQFKKVTGLTPSFFKSLRRKQLSE